MYSFQYMNAFIGVSSSLNSGIYLIMRVTTTVTGWLFSVSYRTLVLDLDLDLAVEQAALIFSQIRFL